MSGLDALVLLVRGQRAPRVRGDIVKIPYGAASVLFVQDIDAGGVAGAGEVVDYGRSESP